MFTTWMNLGDIMLNEISQSEKDTYCMIDPLVVTFFMQLLLNYKGAESNLLH